MISRTWAMVMAVVLLLAPQARSQCVPMGGSSGHDHGAARTEASRSEKKQRQAIGQLLSDPRGRTLLLEAVAGDPELMRALIDRIAGTPEWRALAAERLQPRDPQKRAETVKVSPGQPRESSAQGSAPAPEPLYACPMHPDVTSRAPGKCPKCGMSLERRGGS